MSYSGKNYWIIGASSGIGAALAHELARRGARLCLSARRADALQSVLATLGQNHTALPLDVTKADDVATAAAALLGTFGRIDGVILLSAIYTPAAIEKIDLAAARDIIDVNLMGTLNCLHAVLPILQRQKSGQIALCGSVAGYRGLPNAQPYGATKAAIINLAESLKLETVGSGIDVHVINPGFVRTPMTDKNSFDMPMIISPEQAARSLADQLAGSGFEIHFPKKFTWAMKILRLLPDALYFPIVRRMT